MDSFLIIPGFYTSFTTSGVRTQIIYTNMYQVYSIYYIRIHILTVYIYIGQCEQIFVELRLKGSFLQLGPHMPRFFQRSFFRPKDSESFYHHFSSFKRRGFCCSETQDVGPQNREDLGWDPLFTAGKHHSGKEFH